MVAGVAIGKLLPGAVHRISEIEFVKNSHVNAPIAVLIWLMIYPMIRIPDYKPPIGFRNGHIQTILPSICRKVVGVDYARERIETPDDDFIDLDWSGSARTTLAVISHGLEGSSHRSYVKGMLKVLNRAGIDCCAWNYRSCSGDPFLGPGCYPDAGSLNKDTHLEIPEYGGHTGFIYRSINGNYWSEIRTVRFIRESVELPGNRCKN